MNLKICLVFTLMCYCLVNCIDQGSDDNEEDVVWYDTVVANYLIPGYEFQKEVAKNATKIPVMSSGLASSTMSTVKDITNGVLRYLVQMKISEATKERITNILEKEEKDAVKLVRDKLPIKVTVWLFKNRKFTISDDQIVALAQEIVDKHHQEKAIEGFVPLEEIAKNFPWLKEDPHYAPEMLVNRTLVDNLMISTQKFEKELAENVNLNNYWIGFSGNSTRNYALDLTIKYLQEIGATAAETEQFYELLIVHKPESVRKILLELPRKIVSKKITHKNKTQLLMGMGSIFFQIGIAVVPTVVDLIKNIVK